MALRILIACESSGRVRDAFIKRGHSVVSCDLVPSETPGPHYQGDVMDIINDHWDMMITFPPCTHLANSGAKWFAQKRLDGRQQQAVEFFQALWDAPTPRIAIENPVGIMSTVLRKPDQIIQPWQFGEPFTKSTCLWLKGLPLLHPTSIVDHGAIVTTKSGRRLPEWYSNAPVANRAQIRSRTFQGIADAMAYQWG